MMIDVNKCVLDLLLDLLFFLNSLFLSFIFKECKIMLEFLMLNIQLWNILYLKKNL